MHTNDATAQYPEKEYNIFLSREHFPNYRSAYPQDRRKSFDQDRESIKDSTTHKGVLKMLTDYFPFLTKFTNKFFTAFITDQSQIDPDICSDFDDAAHLLNVNKDAEKDGPPNDPRIPRLSSHQEILRMQLLKMFNHIDKWVGLSTSQ